MSGRNPLKANVRVARFEHVEERLVLSASPWPALVHHAALDAPSSEQVAPMVEVGGQSSLEHAAGDISISPHLNGAHAATGVDVAHSDYGFYGAGQTVVVIDSGIAYDHQALGGGFGAGNRVVGGWDFAENDANPYDDAPAGFHGTHVAGIIGSDDARYTGVASQVDLVALRVFDDSGNGNFQWVSDALDWVIANQDTFENPITTVNLSLGVPNMNVTDIPGWAEGAGGLESKFEALYNAGIFVAVSAGNDFAEFNAKGLSYPAVSDWVVPVSSSNDAGTVMSSFSQRDDHVLTAPGESIVSTVPDELFSFDGNPNDWAAASGTSMASPYVAGASVLIREAYAFMGIENVNQQMIYDVLFDNASIINDPITSGSYHFIDVEAALGMIVTDTFANDAASATAMGMMGDGYSFSEQIGRLNDRDYFSFTAEQSGRMTLSATATHNLAAHWDLVGGGGTVVGDALEFDVVAGQSYTVGLMTDAGVGRYTIASQLTSSAIDLGTVENTQIENVNINDEQWYTLTATRNGILTIEANFSDTDAVAIEVYNADQQRIDTAAVQQGYHRADARVAAGETVLVRLVGSSSDVDVNLWNIVGITGNRADIHGTAGDDAFSVVAGTTHQVVVNGLRYDFSGAEVSDLRLLGKGGDDNLRIVGSDQNDNAVMRPGLATVHGETYSILSTGFEDVNVDGGGGYDTVYLFDSADDDMFSSRPEYASLTGNGFINFSRGFENTRAVANAGGYDTAYFFDSAGDDMFLSRPEYASLTGDGFFNFARGFENTRAVANAGGYDTAYFFDSVGDDLFVSRPEYASLTGDGFYNFARGFDNTRAVANAGGYDTAYFHDSTGDDLFVSRPEYASLTGDGFYNFARGFENARAVANAGGYDTAYFFDSAGDDLFVSHPDYVYLSGDGFYNFARGFDNARAVARAGGNDTAYFYDSTGDDHFLGALDYALLTGDGYLNFARGFDNVRAVANAGGDDDARFLGAVTGDQIQGSGNRATLHRGGSDQTVTGFDMVRANAAAGQEPDLEVDAVDYLFSSTRGWL